MKTVLACLWCTLCFGLFGCASITGDSAQQIRIETVTPDGQPVTGVDCKLANDFSTTSGKSGGSVQVHRSSKDLDIQCTTAGKADASARAISRANAGMAGNIIFGGAVGALIDHNKGTAYTYPTWIRLVFGQMRIYDRKDEKEGFVQIGKLPGAAGSPVVAGAARPQTAGSPPPATAARPATGYARVDDIDAVPYLASRGREAYREWLTKKCRALLPLQSTARLDEVGVTARSLTGRNYRQTRPSGRCRSVKPKRAARAGFTRSMARWSGRRARVWFWTRL